MRPIWRCQLPPSRRSIFRLLILLLHPGVGGTDFTQACTQAEDGRSLTQSRPETKRYRSSMRTELLTSLEDAGNLLDDWRRLTAETVDRTPFIEPDWLTIWWRTFAGVGDEMRLFAMWDGLESVLESNR